MLQELKARMEALLKEIPALVLALKHERTPLSAKVLAAATVVYALSPVDLIPDFIPVLGYLDDLIILPALIALTVRRVPEDVLQDKEGIACMRQWGKNMAYLLKCKEAGKVAGVALPEQEPAVRTDFIR